MASTSATTDVHDEHGHSAPSYDDVNTPVVWLVAIISVLITFLTIALVQGMYYHWESAYLKMRELQFETVNPPAKKEILEQQQLLSGTVEGTISIEEAMKKVIEEYKQPAATTTEN